MIVKKSWTACSATIPPQEAVDDLRQLAGRWNCPVTVTLIRPFAYTQGAVETIEVQPDPRESDGSKQG